MPEDNSYVSDARLFRLDDDCRAHWKDHVYNNTDGTYEGNLNEDNADKGDVDEEDMEEDEADKDHKNEDNEDEDDVYED